MTGRCFGIFGLSATFERSIVRLSGVEEWPPGIVLCLDFRVICLKSNAGADRELFPDFRINRNRRTGIVPLSAVEEWPPGIVCLASFGAFAFDFAQDDRELVLLSQILSRYFTIARRISERRSPGFGV